MEGREKETKGGEIMLVKDLIKDLEKGNRVGEMLRKKKDVSKNPYPISSLSYANLEDTRRAMEGMHQPTPSPSGAGTTSPVFYTTSADTNTYTT